MDSFEFSSIHFSSRDENQTFTQFEQRGWLRITETLTSDGSQGLLFFMPKFELNQSVMNANVVYFFSAVGTGGLEGMCPASLEIAVVTLENNAAQKNFLCHDPPPPPPRYNFLPTVVFFLM